MAPEIYEFGGYMLDVPGRRLSRQDAAIPLPPKTCDLLVALVRRAGRLTTKRDLLDLVWPDAFVGEGILSVHVSALRKALGEQCIETVPRTGYRFAPPVTRHGAAVDPFGGRWLLPALPARPEVHELIGRGRTALMTSSRAELPGAVDAFRTAIELDADYPAGHAGLAQACCAQAELRLKPHGEAYAEARAAALRALALDPSCADAHVALGTVLFLRDWNWAAARRSVERALAADAGHTEAQLLYGRVLEVLGEFGAALAAKRKALERNPLSPLVHLQIAMCFWNQRRYDDTIEWARRSLALDPRHLLAREYTAGAYLMKGDVDRYMEESLAHAESHGVDAAVLDELKRIYMEAGRPGVVRYALRNAPDQPAAALQLALMHGEAGHMDEAFRHLDRALDARDPSLVYLAVGPQFDPLRGDPRFAQRLARMGLAPISKPPQ
ncbi:MAG TPA: winged helix-turn-helix domain-containing protein [Vicinamibacterales bacterium]|nr:winged helix-turn-helix domain-containing protein [Vicinamibacterales bacterium]